MTLSLSITFFIIIVVVVFIIWNTIYYRYNITPMSGMMISMVLGMGAGLTIGVIIGILLSGNLFYSTVLAMMIGIAIGFLSGIATGMIAVLDGIFAGLMGGMMGAMLGEMVATDHQDAIIRLLFLLFIGTIIILYCMMQQDIIKSKSWFSKPIVLLLFYIVIIVGYDQLGPIITTSQLSNSQNHQHTRNNVMITADEYSFSPIQTPLSVGEKITLTLNNQGKLEHHFEIVGLEVDMNEKHSGLHDDIELSNTVHLHSKPGEKAELSFTPLNPGSYRYSCSVPGHEDLGMTGVVEVGL